MLDSIDKEVLKQACYKKDVIFYNNGYSIQRCTEGGNDIIIVNLLQAPYGEIYVSLRECGYNLQRTHYALMQWLGKRTRQYQGAMS